MAIIQNPVLKGFYPDPSILRVGDDYYIATSTFEWFPGVTLLHSKDLCHWETLKAPLSSDSLLDLKGIDTSCGIWAPNLTYSSGIFYLVYTIVYTDRPRYKDTHNFIVSSENIEGPWSKPSFLNCSGFDPCLFHDNDGKKWLVNMTIDHRTDKKRFGGIVLQEFNSAENKLTGPVYRIFSGTEIGTTEGPNLYRHNGYYYLICAEGGTEKGHCCTAARSKSLFGPYEVHPQNPVLTSRADASYSIQRAGHGSLIETQNHEWLMVHLCSRPVHGCSILGRETALQNVEWTLDGWFHIVSDKEKLPMAAFHVQGLKECPITPTPIRTVFDGSEVPREFLTLRQSWKKCGISLSERKGFLRIRGGNSLSSKYFQGFLARRQQHLSCDCKTCMEFKPVVSQQMAGLVCYYNYDNYYYLKIGFDENMGRCISVTSVINRRVEDMPPVPVPDDAEAVYLMAEIRSESLRFYWSADDTSYFPLDGRYDMKNLSDERVDGNGFTGAMVGICCQDLEGRGTYADFKWFEYRPVNE